MTIFFILLAILAGSMLPLQGVINSQLARALDNIILAILISFITGVLTLLPIYLLRNNTGNGLQQLTQISPTLYLGGILGAFYVTLAAILIPKIGVANTMIAIIFGQILLSLLLDHFGLLGIEIRALNGLRMLGAGLVLGGLVLVVKN